MVVQMKPTYEELEQENASLRAELAKKDRIISCALQLVENRTEAHTSRLIDLECFLLDPDAVLEGKKRHIDVGHIQKQVGVDKDTTRLHFAAKAQAGGINYTVETVQNEKGEIRKRATAEYLPDTYFTTDTKTSMAMLKKQEANKKSEKKRLEKLKEELLKCPNCGRSDELHMGLVHVCDACGYTGSLETLTPDTLVKAEDIRIMVSVDEQEATQEAEEKNPPVPDSGTEPAAAAETEASQFSGIPTEDYTPYEPYEPLPEYEAYTLSQDEGKQKPDREPKPAVVVSFIPRNEKQTPLPACPYCHTNTSVTDRGGCYGCISCRHLFNLEESRKVNHELT